jgi:hypothetical protein
MTGPAGAGFGGLTIVTAGTSGGGFISAGGTFLWTYSGAASTYVANLVTSAGDGALNCVMNEATDPGSTIQLVATAPQTITTPAGTVATLNVPQGWLARVIYNAYLNSWVLVNMESISGVKTAGSIHQTGASTLTANTATQVGNMTSTFLRGGMTLVGNNLVVPVAGVYQVEGAITFSAGSAVCYNNVLIYRAGVNVKQVGGYQFTAGVTSPGLCVAGLVLCAAGDTLGLWGSSNLALTCAAPAQQTYLDATLVSL